MSDPIFVFPPETTQWEAFENALRQWVIAASGLTPEKVIRAEQDGPRPATVFAEVRIGDVRALGAADAVSTEYDAGGPAGSEVTQTVRGQREFAATVRMFTSSAVGAESARALLLQVQAGLRLPSVRDILHEAGLTCFDQGVVQSIPAILDTRYEGRATLTARFYCEVTISEATGIVGSVEVTDEGENPDDVFIIDGP